jgi:allantoicase
MNDASNLPDFARLWTDLAQPRLGGAAILASDEFFAPKERMLSPEPAVFIPGKYDENGKWMDGWESRRKRSEGHDFCVVRLGRPGIVKGVDIDTSHFTGNYPPAASIDAWQGSPLPATRSGVTCGSTFIPMAAWHACAFMARSISTGARPTAKPWSISLPWRMAGGRSPATMRIMAGRKI